MDEAKNERLGELIMELANGNKDALEGIARIVEPILFAIGNRYYYNYADIEDAVHNLYLTLEEKAKNFQQNDNACAWIITVFKNSIKSNFRAKKREKQYWEEEAMLSQGKVVEGSEKYIENHLFLREIFSHLTEEEMYMFIYYYWSRCTVREVAQILHKPKSTMEDRLKKLKEKIYELL